MSPDEVKACLRSEVVHGIGLGDKVDRELVLDLYEQGIIALHLHGRDGGKNSKALAEAKVRLAQLRTEAGS